MELVEFTQPAGLNPTFNQPDFYTNFLTKFANTENLCQLMRLTLFHQDFNVSNTFMKGSEINVLIKTFLNDISFEIKNIQSTKFATSQLLSLIDITKHILAIKEDANSRILHYNNVESHFSNASLFCQKVLTDIKRNPIEESVDFQKQLEDFISIISAFNGLKTVKTSIMNLSSVFDEQQMASMSPLNTIQLFRDAIYSSYDQLSSLNILSGDDAISDYIIFGNKGESDSAIAALNTHIEKLSNYFETGYDIIDNNVDGLEGSSVSIISAPSNHGKSIFMLNICRKLIENNASKFNPATDIVILITLEDDIYKLSRRIISIFGNNDTKSIKKLYMKSAEVYNDPSTSANIHNEARQLFHDVVTESVISYTDGVCKLAIKHSNENSFSVGDIRKFIDKQKLNGYVVKAVFVDYIDVMIPSAGTGANNDYDNHGSIVQEMRAASRHYSVPFITITQNGRGSENTMQELTNGSIGDSYKKVRLADNIFMVRQRRDLDVLSEAVKNDIMTNSKDISLSSLANSEYIDNIIPMECKITKAKEGGAGVLKFHIFSTINLRIYDTLDEFFKDMEELKLKSKALNDRIDVLGSSSNVFGGSPIEENILDNIII